MGLSDPLRTSDLFEQLSADLIDCGGVYWCGTSTGAGNLYYLSPYPRNPNLLLLNEYEAGLRYQFIADKTNTDVVQIAIYTNPSSPTLLALKALTKNSVDDPLAANDLLIGGVCTIIDMGATFRLLSNGEI